GASWRPWPGPSGALTRNVRPAGGDAATGPRAAACGWPEPRKTLASRPSCRRRSGPARGPDAPELPVPAERGRNHLFGGRGLGADVLADRNLALDDAVAEHAEPLHLDLDDVAGLDGPGVGRRAREDDVARHQCDRPRDVGDEVVHVPDHLVGGAVLADLAVHVRPDALAVKVPVVHEAGTERAERVGALHAQHRSGIGVAEVVQAEVVRDGEARDELGRLVRRDVAALAPDDDRDLALVVEVPAPR